MKAVDVKTAVTQVKANAKAKFDETVEVHIHLKIDPKASEQMVRGSVALPSGAPKQKKVVVIKKDTESEKLLAAIEETGNLDADVVIATPDMMSKVAKVAKILGPKGLMPNPKTGTVTPDPDKAVAELAGGKISFKMDQLGNIHETIGKVSWDEEKISANLRAILDAINAPIQSITIASTMGSGIRVTL